MTIDIGSTEHLTTEVEYVVFNVPVYFKVPDDAKKYSQKKVEEILREYDDMEKNQPGLDLSKQKESMREFSLADRDYVRYV